jgi:hypothetical protein
MSGRTCGTRPQASYEAPVHGRGEGAPDPDSSRASHIRAIARTLPARDQEIATALTSLGTLLLDRGAPRQALPLLREPVDIYREVVPAGDSARHEAEGALARFETAFRPQ